MLQKVIAFNKHGEKILSHLNNSLKENKEQYESLINNIDVGITLIDDNYRILMVSNSNMQMHNISGQKVLGKECFCVFAKRDSVCATCPGTVALATGKPAVVEDEGVRDDGTRLTVRIKAFPVFDSDGKARKFIEVVEDITDRKKSEREIRQLAYFDTLTDLPNRTLLKDRLNQLLIHAKRFDEKLAVLFIDLDNFKGINDTKGHAIGDKLLTAVGKRLVKCVRSNDTVARLGGDEFVIVASDIQQEQDVTHIGQKILDMLGEPLEIEGNELFTSASIGIALFPLDGQTVGKLLKNADTAMYAAKESGRNNYKFFSREMNRKAVERMEIETSLRRALDKEEFYLLYQPQVNVRTGSITGVEALLRWNHPERGLLLPDKFIPVAEDTGLIIQIGEWVIRTACRQLKEWHDQGLGPLRLALNISGKQFKESNFGKMLEGVIKEVGIKPQNVELELTESVLMANAAHTVKMLKRIKNTGVTLAIDDFGTGYCSLAYLKNFPIARLKIDKTFISEVTTTKSDALITEAIVALSRTLGLQVIAEGVENIEQMHFLASRDCHEMQGYLFSKPKLADEIDMLLRRQGTSQLPPLFPESEFLPIASP
ncbi:GGDEF and EAL domain-containing protein [Geobacter sp. DSM 9736]|uniref:sensor domain-containing protein n=1 Tax=Geobacter sp. DSM 9736 TaxID=1277350 RepID=UPI00155F6CC4|nr:GGDEF and EAL domain-containing protein [Geobacter sp. DSM 9736]